jgi:hypothetical protein
MRCGSLLAVPVQVGHTYEILTRNRETLKDPTYVPVRITIYR